MTRTAAVEIEDETIDLFCKNIVNLRSLTTRTFAEERMNPAGEVIREAIDDVCEEDPLQTPIIWYVALRAVERFQGKYQRWPGTNDNMVRLIVLTVATIFLDEKKMFSISIV